MEAKKLTKNEAIAVGFFVRLLRTGKGQDAAITLGYLVDQWNQTNPSREITDTSGKRIIRHIRNNGLIKRLMADHYGYFVADNDITYERYLQMLQRRIKHISRTYSALKSQS